MPFSPAIEACRVPDERLAGAYEETSAEHRSWIKTTLALAGATYPAPPSRLSITSENAAAGFGFARTRETAPWAVLLIGEGYASAVRLAAAIMPARLAGVEPVFAVWTGAETAPSGLFAALELTGVEQVFAMRDPAPLLRELPGRGRILRFGKAPLPECPCPVWSDRAPRIERTALPDTAVLWAHPDALPADDGADVVYAGQTIIGEDTPLVLEAGLEGCWLHTDLTPDFFMNERLALSALKLES